MSAEAPEPGDEGCGVAGPHGYHSERWTDPDGTLHMRSCGGEPSEEQAARLLAALTPAPWRFDVPEVPAHVTCFQDAARLVWVRLIDDPPFWGQWWGGTRGLGSRRLRIGEAINFCTLPLVECEDPRAAS